MEDRSKRTETVRPQSNERCEKRQGCDSVLSATNGEDDVELNGETDDEDMEDGEMGFDDGSAQVRNIRDPGQPTVKEHDHTSSVQNMVQVLRDGTRSERTAQEIRCSRGLGRVPHVSMDNGFLGERESEEQVSLVLVIRERRDKKTWAMLLVPRKGTEFPWIAKRAARFIDQLGHNTGTLRCDNEPAIEALAREIAPARQEVSPTVPERPPVGEGQSNGVIDRAVGLVAGQARTLEHRTGTRVPSDARILCWLVGYAAYLMNRCDVGSDGKRPCRGCMAEGTAHPHWNSERRSCRCRPSQREGGKVAIEVPPRSVCWDAELVVRSSGCHRARTGDQNTVGECQEDPRVREIGREQNAQNAAAMMHSTLRSGWRDPRRWCPLPREMC